MLVSVEAWADEVVVRARGLPSERTAALAREFAERIFEVEISIADDAGTVYSPTTSARGGSGTIFRADIRRCTRVPRSASLVAADIACNVARRAALGCHRLSHRTWGTCTAAGHAWNCTSTSPAGRPSLESCWLASKSRWLKGALGEVSSARVDAVGESSHDRRV